MTKTLFFIPAILLLLTVLCLVSCENQEALEIKFEQNKFVPETTEEVKFKVIDFLSHTTAPTTVSLRSEYEDKEVNEGFWTLEAAANYISNVNLDNDLVEKITYTLNIDNKIEGGIIMMDGPDMTTKFNDLQTLINDSAVNLSQVPKVVDAKLVSANSVQTKIDFKVLFGPPPNTSPETSGCDWASSTDINAVGDIISQCISDNIPEYDFLFDVIDLTTEDFEQFPLPSCFFDLYQNVMLFRDGYEPFSEVEMEEYYIQSMAFIDCAINNVELGDGLASVHGNLMPITFLTQSRPGVINLGAEFTFEILILARVIPFG
jgi:hypothetical protein